MSPTPEESNPMTGKYVTKDVPISDDSIVITGMSGLMPGCRGLDEFADKLYNMENLTTEEPRMKFNHPEAAPYQGNVPDIDRFDAQFFMIYYRLSHNFDAMARKLLEQTYQAIIDAGVCPTELSGKRVGVFVASNSNDMAHKIYSLYSSEFGLLGCSKTMLSNRISYWLNAKGPSYSLDAACSGSTIALEKAYELMRQGHCDAAIVGGASLTLHPYVSIHTHRLTPLNPDGKTKCYDVNADGITISESITALFLQKYKDARRVYAEIYHIKSGFVDGLGEIFVDKNVCRDPTKLTNFLDEFYREAGISPDSVEFVEGCGAALPEADKIELQALERVFCKGRSKPLLVGSVRSNMGYADAASGCCGIVKLLLAYQKGVLAANLNCDNPRRDIAALQDGRMRILTKHEQFERSYTALNNFSFSGLNVHVLLKGHWKNKDHSRYNTNMPYLVTVSGRQESAVEKILDNITTNELNPEEIALYHEIYKRCILKHMARGYGIYSTENRKTVTVSKKIDYYDDIKRPLWFVYSGMGSQWAGMGKELLRIPIFAAAIERCDKVLKPKGVDIVNIITTPDESVFDNILNSFVGIAAIQIGLTDVLRAVGLVPDNIIGHSVGELGCAYADGCCTAEEMILLSYSRGLISTQKPFIRGSMAAVGMGYKQISKLCPPEIEVACHNGPDSSTISGPVDIMRQFVRQLTSRGIFAKEVRSSNIAYHSRYIAEAGPELLRYCKEILKKPKLRSKRWLSTSVRQDKWHEKVAKYSSAEYHTNNLLSPVLFEETSRLVPSGAVLVEVAPHGLLQAILKRSLPADCRHVPLTKRQHRDSVLFLLEALGKLYMEGYDLNINALYPSIEFPVSTQTRQLSHLVEWVHTEKWHIFEYVTEDRRYTAVYKPKVTIYDPDYAFLKGCVIEGTRKFPLAGALVFVWDTLSMISRMPLRETSVQFHNVKCHELLELHDDKPLRLEVMLQQGSGRFEVTNEDTLVVEGHIVAMKTMFSVSSTLDNKDEIVLNSMDIYKLLLERCYEYKNEFRVISSANLYLTKAQMLWRNNWVTFIDGALQLCTLRRDHNAVSYPLYINRICIDVNTHVNTITNNGKNNMDDTFVEVTAYADNDIVSCGGLSIKNVIFKDKPLVRQPLSLQTFKFIPFFQEDNRDITMTLYVFFQMVAENFDKKKLSVLNIENMNISAIIPILDKINAKLNDCPTVKKIEVINATKEDVVRVKYCNENPDVIILNHFTCNVNLLQSLYHLFPNAFLVTIGVNVQDIYVSPLYIQVSAIGTGLSRLELARWKSETVSAVVTVDRSKDIQSLIVSRNNLQSHQKLVIFTSYPPVNGLKNLVKRWRGEEDRNQVYLAMVNDKHRIDIKQLPSFELAFNVFDQNTWGGEYYLPLNKYFSNASMVVLQCGEFGNLSSLYWAQIPDSCHKPGGLNVDVHYAELNIYDVQRALAQISVPHNLKQGFGMSFSGLSESGEYVMGLTPTSSVLKQISSSPEFLWPVPPHWSLEDAATVPLAYTIAFYCLGIKSKLVPGMVVLVHGGAGAVGQAAISIALAHGCIVFTTVSDQHKKKFIRKLFPDLPEQNIGNSRDDSFKNMIMIGTRGKGCQIIISCVQGSLKHTTLACGGFMGTIFDLVQIHTQENFEYGMSNMWNSRSYVTIDISSIFSNQNVEELRIIRMMISEGISRGYVRPLSRVTYAPHDAARAFHLLAASRHRGRVLLRMCDHPPRAQPRLSCPPNFCHIILCDKDGFGINFADRLVERGVNKLYLHVPDIPNYLLIKRQSWYKQGVEVKIVSHILDSIDTIRNLLQDAVTLGPIEGMYVVAIGLTDNETKVNINSKIYNLDLASRELGTQCIRNFAVINEDNNTGLDVCISRKHCKLNSLLLQLKLGQFTDSEEDNDKKLMWSSGVEAVETALLSNELIVIAKLQKVQQNVGEGATGFEGYFSYIDSDEMNASTELVFMPTLTHTSNTRPDEFEDNETYLCIVPGVEGHHERFRGLCELLKVPAVVLQLGLYKHHESIQEIAQRLVDVMMKKINMSNQFCLLGYEFGVPIVIEMTRILESYGLNGTVYCLGGTPSDVCSILNKEFQDMPEETLQITLLQHLHYLIVGEKIAKHDDKIRDMAQYSDKVKYVVDNLCGRVPYSSQYIESLLEATYSRIKLLRSCNTEFNLLKAKMIILRAKTSEMSPKEMWSFSHHDVIIHQLESTLDHAPRDLKCAALINNYLENDILTKFCKRNRCEIFRRNAHTF